jgi:hypothetical protein
MNWSAPRQIRFCACTKMSMNRGDFRSLYQGLLHPRPQAQARAALTVALGQAVDLRRNSDAEAWSHSICISP